VNAQKTGRTKSKRDSKTTHVRFLLVSRHGDRLLDLFRAGEFVAAFREKIFTFCTILTRAE
jgi:hypothetical protein